RGVARRFLGLLGLLLLALDLLVALRGLLRLGRLRSLVLVLGLLLLARLLDLLVAVLLDLLDPFVLVLGLLLDVQALVFLCHGTSPNRGLDHMEWQITGPPARTGTVFIRVSCVFFTVLVTWNASARPAP